MGGDGGARPAGIERPVRDSSASEIRSRRVERETTQELRVRTASAPPLEEAAVAPFARFGRFDLLGRIATGGMAEILLARESMEEASGSRHVVIKAVRGEFAEDGEFAKMFLDEGRLAMRLSHPNICTVYECGRHEGRFFIAMEYVHGRTLREVLVRAAQHKRQLPIPLLLRVFALVAEALDSAHRAKDAAGQRLAVVHRDVSPHNLMIRYDGVVKLLDFGVAKAENSQHSTESGALKGKFSYMSPEQAMGSAVDARADIFSLGVCIFEAVTGRRLFQRKAQYDTLKAILESELPRLASFRDDVPAGLQRIVDRALHRDPEQRYQRAADLQHDLEALLAELREVASTARIAELMQALFEEEANRPPALEVDDELRERYASRAAESGRARSRWAVWAGAVVVALALGGGLWLGLRDPEQPDAPRAAAEPAVAEPAVAEPVAPPPAMPEVATRGEADPPPQAEAISAEPPGDGTLAPTSSERPGSAAANGAEGSSPRRITKGSPRASRGARPPRRGTVIVTDPGF